MNRPRESNLLLYRIDLMIITPYLETWIMAGFVVAIIKIFKQLYKNDTSSDIPYIAKITIAFLCAVMALFAHFRYEDWGVHAAWLFFIYSMLFIKIRSRASINTAVVLVALVHAFNNLLCIPMEVFETRYFIPVMLNAQHGI